jgi:hypothetical protein
MRKKWVVFHYRGTEEIEDSRWRRRYNAQAEADALNWHVYVTGTARGDDFDIYKVKQDVK